MRSVWLIAASIGTVGLPCGYALGSALKLLPCFWAGAAVVSLGWVALSVAATALFVGLTRGGNDDG